VTPGRWQRVEELFHGALNRPQKERAAWLAVQDSDPTVREEVQSLLDALHNQDSASGATDDTSSRVPENEDAAPVPGDRFGPYRLVRLLGSGGMSAVYLGERADGLFERQVAVKVVGAHRDAGDFLRRFENEGKLMASLQHPNIASLLDGGISSGGHPYLVLELVMGERLDRYCDQGRLPVGERLRLFREVCEAVDFAHRRGVLHRPKLARRMRRVCAASCAAGSPTSWLDLWNTILGAATYRSGNLSTISTGRRPAGPSRRAGAGRHGSTGYAAGGCGPPSCWWCAAPARCPGTAFAAWRSTRGPPLSFNSANTTGTAAPGIRC